MSDDEKSEPSYAATPNEQIENMARGKGCENCGSDITGHNSWGMAHCGRRGCLKSLSVIGKSRDLADWYKRQPSR